MVKQLNSALTLMRLLCCVVNFINLRLGTMHAAIIAGNGVNL